MLLADKIASAQVTTGKKSVRRSLPHHSRITPISLPHTNAILNCKPACSCGGTCPKCQAEKLGVQPKLKIGAPNDKYEQEADRVADQVMRMSEPKVQRQEMPEEEAEEAEEFIQTKPLASSITPLVQRQTMEEDEGLVQTKNNRNTTPKMSSMISSNIQSLQGGGQPLPGSARSFFEPRIGADFSNVRVHNDTRAARAAQSVNARAFTLGHDVVFGAGEYSPETSSGRKLLAHELTHVVQQSGGFNVREKALTPLTLPESRTKFHQGQFLLQRQSLSPGQYINCSPARQQMIEGHLDHARSWLSPTLAILNSISNSQVSEPDLRIVLTAYLISFDGDFLRRGRPLGQQKQREIIRNLNIIRDNLVLVQIGLNRSVNYRCVPNCRRNDLAYVYENRDEESGLVFPTDTVNVCTSWFRCQNYYKRVSTLIHEMAHTELYSFDIGHDIYEWSNQFFQLDWGQSRRNPDSYTTFVRQVFHRGARRPPINCDN